MSGLLGLNLLVALSAIIAERAQGRGADVTWSTGKAGGIMWDNCWIALASGNKKEEGKGRGGGGGRPAGTGGGLGVWWPEEVFVPPWSRGGELLREEADQAGLTRGSHQ